MKVLFVIAIIIAGASIGVSVMDKNWIALIWQVISILWIAHTWIWYSRAQELQR